MTPRWNRRRCRWAAGLIFLALPHQSPSSLSFSTLPLDLVGVVMNMAAPSRSVCLIRRTYPSKAEEFFCPGQKAFDFAEVLEIHRDGIVLHNLVTDGLEFLTFPGDRPFPKTPPPPPPPVQAKSAGGVEIEVPKDTINHYLNNLPDLLDSAFAAPRYREAKNGQKSIEGYEISRIKEGSIADQLGLKNGDVVLALDGVSLDSLATVMRLVGRIQNIPRAKMTILRNGQKLDFVFKRK
jgi:hypothetical protein